MSVYILYDNGILEKDGNYLAVNELDPDYQDYLAWLALGGTPTIKPASDYLAKLLTNKQTRQQLKDQYQAALDRLLQIQNATNPTNAQVIAAIQDMAKYERIMLQVLNQLFR